jgi:hypothetical protein
MYIGVLGDFSGVYIRVLQVFWHKFTRKTLEFCRDKAWQNGVPLPKPISAPRICVLDSPRIKNIS